MRSMFHHVSSTSFWFSTHCIQNLNSPTALDALICRGSEMLDTFLFPREIFSDRQMCLREMAAKAMSLDGTKTVVEAEALELLQAINL